MITNSVSVTFQVDVMVVPMVGQNMTSMRIGGVFAQKAGTRLQHNFDRSRKRQSALKPGDVLDVDGVPVIACQKILFIECLRWDALKGNSEKVRVRDKIEWFIPFKQSVHFIK